MVKLMKSQILGIFSLLFFPVLVLGGEKEVSYLKETMLPLAREFLLRIGETNDLPSTTNHIYQYKVDYFDDRIGCMAKMRLTNGCVFCFHTETNLTEVWSFHRNLKTYYELENSSDEKIKALKTLNSQNKLNKKNAAALALKFFKMLGHKEDNFHPLDFYPPEISQSYWAVKQNTLPVYERYLPYYEITWYRKDVKLEDLKNHDSNAELKTVMLEVSGIDFGLVSYSKGMLPIGSDF